MLDVFNLDAREGMKKKRRENVSNLGWPSICMLSVSSSRSPSSLLHSFSFTSNCLSVFVMIAILRQQSKRTNKFERVLSSAQAFIFVINKHVNVYVLLATSNLYT